MTSVTSVLVVSLLQLSFKLEITSSGAEQNGRGRLGGVNGQRKVKMLWKVLNNQMKGNAILLCAFSSRDVNHCQNVSHSSHWFPDLNVLLVGWALLYRIVSPAILGGISPE